MRECSWGSVLAEAEAAAGEATAIEREASGPGRNERSSNHFAQVLGRSGTASVPPGALKNELPRSEGAGL